MLFGPSGVKKQRAAEALAKVCRDRMPGCKTQCFDISDFLDRSTHTLLHFPEREQRAVVGEAIGKIAKLLGRADLSIVSLHASHLCAGIFAFPCTAASVKLLRPNIFLTLFDDVYACHEKLQTAGYPFKYSQLLTWRQIECGIVDNLAVACNVENIYLAAKHPGITAYRLIFEPEIPRIYSASQITAVRDKPRLRAAIEAHRRWLHEQFAVFDPTTIDDRLLVNYIPQPPGRRKTFSVNSDARWPYDLAGLGESFASLVTDAEAIFPLSLNVREALELSKPAEQSSDRSIIDVQIRHRDFRYIDQVDIVSAHRPLLGKHESSGVAAEKTYAANVAGKTVVEYSTKADLSGRGSKPFSTPLAGPLCHSVVDFRAALESEAAKEAKRRCQVKGAAYERLVTFRQRFQKARKS